MATYTITNNAPIDVKLGETNEVYSVLQGIALLISTRIGTIPMYRDFGLPMEYVNKPSEIAETIALQEVSDALDAFEPRATLVDVRITESETDLGRMEIEVEVEI